MSLYVYNLKNLPKFNHPIFMIGSFEAFHAGHNLLYEKAKELNLLHNNTRDIIIVYFSDVEQMPKNLGKKFSDHLFRLHSFAQLGFKHALKLDYKLIHALEPNDFIDLIIDKQNDFDIVVGSDFKYGSKAKANVKTLKSRFKDKIHSIDIMRLNNEQKVSTSFIKEALIAGDIDLVNLLNLYKYGFNAKIFKQNDILNLQFDLDLTPMRAGVYCVNIIIEDINYYALMLITNDNQRLIEMIDFSWTSLSKHDCKIVVFAFLRPFFTNSQIKANESDFTRAKEYFTYLSN
ncbi:riboflavin biosynthesis protein [Mycoplasmopsis phocirhinis]|uniref:FAD synthase n=1 Tax=Mycoplasmopsis phocirhinis TaxID=142650 RepID=A0A4P6MT64_9BACT|nr:riboflavin biosynthesis protein [Mycoplasmopsis phocirhinis]QBF34894.1 riboflavin biosynthesis protein [Mycoplasmopsis phocirhinis]